MSTPTTSPHPNFGSSEPVISSVPADRVAENIRQVQSAIGQVKRYCTAIVEDVVKPSIKTFMETCDTNPRTAAVVATPALLAFLIVFTFFVLSTLVLVLWSCLTISIGIAFVIIGGVMSLLFKLLIVVLATIPLAGVATGLLVGANAASQFILNKLPTSISSGSFDWNAVGDTAISFGRQAGQNMQNMVPVLLTIRDALVTLAIALNHAVQTAMAGLQEQSGTAEAPPAAESEDARLNTESGAPVVAEGPKIEPQEEALDESMVVEHVMLVDEPESSSARGLKRRAPFPNVEDDAEEHKSGN